MLLTTDILHLIVSVLVCLEMYLCLYIDIHSVINGPFSSQSCLFVLEFNFCLCIHLNVVIRRFFFTFDWLCLGLIGNVFV